MLFDPVWMPAEHWSYIYIYIILHQIRPVESMKHRYKYILLFLYLLIVINVVKSQCTNYINCTALIRKCQIKRLLDLVLTCTIGTVQIGLLGHIMSFLAASCTPLCTIHIHTLLFYTITTTKLLSTYN